MGQWLRIGDFDAGNIPNLDLQTGQQHLMRLQLPVQVPDWVIGPIRDLLARFGVQATIDGRAGTIEITFTA